MRGRFRLPSLRAFVVLTIVGAAGIGACDLNPQPIPPGEEPDGGNSDFGSGGGGSADATTNNPAPEDAGVSGLDSGREGDTGAPPEADGGDAGEDAGDAEADADAG